jgi:hypothetical protein
MDREIYKDTDRVHVVLWKQLVYFGCREAAVGLLRDVFDMLVRVEGVSAEGDEYAAEQRDDSAANLRQDAMEMLGHRDGRDLRMWLDAYRRKDRREQCLEAVREWVEEARVGIHQDGPLREGEAD